MTGNAAEGHCRVCAADVPNGAVVCPRCGTSQRMEPCPLCGAVTGISPNDEMRYVCDVCGGPRVPLDRKGVKRGSAGDKALKRANAARMSRAKNRAGAVVAGLGLAGVLGLIALYAVLGAIGVVSPGLGFVMASLLTAGPLAALVAALVARSKAAGKVIGPALDEAWLAVATDVAEQSREPMTARLLAEALRIEEPQAEELVALLEANDVVRGDGKLRLESRMRFEEPTDTRAEAEAEADAVAEEARRSTEARDKR